MLSVKFETMYFYKLFIHTQQLGMLGFIMIVSYKLSFENEIS